MRAKDDAAARQRIDATFDSGDPKLLEHYRSLAADHLEVLAGDKGEANLGLDDATWQRLADTVDLIVDPAALVNHVLPYSELFGPNVVGTAELIRIALTTRIKPYIYVSTIGVGDQIEPGKFVEEADIRQMSPTRKISDNYANGYGNSKWGGEVLLREAHDLCGLPVSVFRCDMIMADTTYAGQLNVPDMFTRMMLSLVATGIAPYSFYELDADGNRQRAHYDGLPVEFIADAISTLGVNVVAGYRDLPRDEPVRRRHQHGHLRRLAGRGRLPDRPGARIRRLVGAVRDDAARPARQAASSVSAAAAAQLPEARASDQRVARACGSLPGGCAGQQDRTGEGHPACLRAGDRQVHHRPGVARLALTGGRRRKACPNPTFDRQLVSNVAGQQRRVHGRRFTIHRGARELQHRARLTVHLCRVVERGRRDLVENTEVLRGQSHLQAGEVAFEVFQPPGPDDWHDGLRPREQPRQSDCRRSALELIGDCRRPCR